MTTTANRENLFRIARIIAQMIQPESNAGKMLYRNPCQIYGMLQAGQGVYSTDNFGDPISFCGWYEYDGFIEVGSTITHPSHRGRGLATECLYGVLDAIQSSGKQIIAFCNAESTRLFQRTGFAEQPKSDMPPEAMEFCESCKEFGSFPACHCRFLTFGQNVRKCHKGIWHTIIHDPVGDTLASCAELYCQVWAEPPWDEYEWDLDAVERELREASTDPNTIFAISQVRGAVNGFTIGYPVDQAALAAKAGGDQLHALCYGYDQLFYVAELGVGRDNRGHGTGKLLSSELLQRAEMQGFKRFVLRTDIEAHPARALYSQLGFVDTGIRDANHPTRTYWVRDV